MLPDSDLYLAAAPVDCELVNGKIYTISPLTDRQQAELLNVVRMFPVISALRTIRSLGPLLTKPQIDSMLDGARREGEQDAVDYSKRNYDGKLFADTEGVLRFAMVSLKKAHPSLTYEQFSKDMYGENDTELHANCLAIIRSLNAVNPSSKDEVKDCVTEEGEKKRDPLAK